MNTVNQVLQASLTAQPFLVTGRLLDRIPELDNPLGAAFSIRRLYTRYRGPLLRVRRSSDNAERDIGFLQTEMDVQAIESFCAGFQGFVSVWYDQTGNGRHARQPDISLQPQIVADGAMIRDSLNNYAVRFNGSYLTTEWEPLESELKDGSAMLSVLTPSTGVQGQTGSVEAVNVVPPIEMTDYPEYPFDKLPVGTDIYKLDATFVPGVLRNIETDPERTPIFRPQSLSVYVGPDKRLRSIDVAERSVQTIEAFFGNDPSAIPEPVLIQGGPPLLQADVIPVPNQGTESTETQWSRGIVGVDGRVYGIPFDAETVMVIDPEPEVPSDRVSFLTFPDGNVAQQKGKYRGAALHDNGKIYCAPWNASRILVIDTNPSIESGDRIAFFDDSYNNVPSEPAFSSMVYVHPKLYCIPFGASQVMVLNPNAPNPNGTGESPNIRYAVDVERTLDNGTVEVEVANLSGSGKFTDGTILQGNIVAVPGASGTFLRVLPDSDPTTQHDRLFVFGTTGTDVQLLNAGNGYWFQEGNPEAEVPLRLDGGFTKRDVDRATAIVRVSPTRVVTDITINNGGTGYIEAPTFIFGATTNIRGAAVESSENVLMEDVFEEINGEQVYRGRRVKSVQLTNCGEGYVSEPVFTVASNQSGKGENAVLRAEIDSLSALQNLIAINVENGGSGYFYRDDVTVDIDSPPSGGEQARARVESWVLADPTDDPDRPIRGWSIESVSLTNAGRGYVTRPNVRILGGKGDTVEVSASSAIDGHIRSIEVPSEGIGSGFVVDQTPSPIQIDDPLPGGILASARISSVSETGAITSIQVTNGGQGYVEAPRVFVNMNGSEIELDVMYRNHGRLINLEMGDPGFGYTEPPTVTIDPDQIYERPGNNRRAEIKARLEPPGTSDNVVSDDRWIEVHSNESGTIAYGVPFNAWRTVRIQVESGGEFTATLSDGSDLVFEDDSGTSDFEINFSEAKWARGVVSNNQLWCIPFSENRVLAINFDDTGALNTSFYGNLRGQWNSATRTKDGVIYAFPASGDSVLVLDPRQPDRIETLRYGNLQGEGARFSDGVTIPESKNSDFADMMYAIPDQSPDIVEINPGVPLRSVDLPPPHVLMFDATGGNDPNQRAIVAFAPTSENGLVPGKGQVQVIDFRDRDKIQKWTLEVEKHPTDEGIPWFAEGVALEEEVWPNGHSEGEVGALRAVFLPYWNSNSSYRYEGRVGILTVHLAPRLVETGTDPTTLLPILAVDTDFPTITGLSWNWTSTRVDITQACPFASRSSVCLGPNIESGRVIAWVPRETEQALVTLNMGDESPEVQIGEGTFENAAKRNESFVEWASAQSDRNGIVTLTFPTSSSATQIETLDTYSDRLRYCAGIFTNGRIVCMPARRDRMVIREIDPTLASPWNPGSFELNVRTILESDAGLSNFWNFAGAVHIPPLNLIYGIPHNYNGILQYNTVEKVANAFGSDFFRNTIQESMIFGNPNIRDNRQYYWGGVFDGRHVYCIPYNTDVILRIDPFEPNSTRRFDTSLRTPSSEFGAYRHAIIANDRIYFIPFRAQRVLEIDPSNPLDVTVRYVGPNLSGDDKWSHSVLAPDGNVYAVPWNSDHILRLTPRRGSTEPEVHLIPHGQRGSWSRGSIGFDGNMYMVPFRARGVLVFDPRTNQRFQIGRFNTRSTIEQLEQWIDCVDLPSNEIFAIPASRQVGLRVFPEGNTIGTMDFRNNGRTFRTSALVQREFRSRPERLVRQTLETGVDQTYTIFFGADGYAVHAFDRTRNVGTVAFGPRFENGLTSLVLDRSEGNIPILFTLRPTRAFETTFFIGGIAGLLTEERTNEFAMLDQNGSYRFQKGTGENRIVNLFNVVFGEGNTGVVSTFTYRRGTQGVMETFLRGVPVNLTEYEFEGNASGGAYFQIGRVERSFSDASENQTVPSFVSQFTGTLSELIVFTSDQRSLGVELGRLQTSAYNAF